MSYAKYPSQPPQLDVGAGVALINKIAAKVGLPGINSTNPGKWKRWVGGEGPDFDGADTGSLRDVVDANAYGLEAQKATNDRQDGQIAGILERVTAAENEIAALQVARPPFPASS